MLPLRVCFMEAYSNIARIKKDFLTGYPDIFSPQSPKAIEQVFRETRHKGLSLILTLVYHLILYPILAGQLQKFREIYKRINSIFWLLAPESWILISFYSSGTFSWAGTPYTFL
jgi:hypothetical protein